jgi:hypothetical protein
MIPGPLRRRAWIYRAALPLLPVLGLLAGGCVRFRYTGEDDLPAAWRTEVTGISWRLPQGRFASEGQLVAGEGTPTKVRLEEMFFRGQLRRSAPAEFIELTTEGNGAFTARAWRAGQVAAELRHNGRIDPQTGWLELSDVPAKENQKFGPVATSLSLRVGLGADGALYVRAHGTAAGVVLFVPAVGSSTVWGRWEPARP